MLKLLHLSWEIPDHFCQRKTKAVANLIKATDVYFEASTLSFNRCNKNSFSSLPFSTKGHTAIRYFGLPYGLLHLSSLRNLYRQVHEKFAEFDLLHGHKLTFEGVLCYLAYRKMGKRYVITLRGNTDFKFIKWLPHCRRIFRKVAENSERIFCLNPWSAEKLKVLYPNISNKIVVLPNICHVEKFIDSLAQFEEKKDEKFILVTTFNLDVYKLKRFELVLRILKRLAIPASILVIGAGSPAAEVAVRKLIEKYSVQDKVQLLGFKNHDEIVEIYKKCDMFLLPSKSESFGMAYLEALSCGLPVLQSEGVGLDGYFINEPFYFTAESEDEFIAAIERSYKKIYEIKSELIKYIKKGSLDKFSVNNIVEKYVSEIYSIFTN
jgi:glycosyltransferase involved in cell wall biosynthesis